MAVSVNEALYHAVEQGEEKCCRRILSVQNEARLAETEY
jgi:hypothetical protein